MPKTQFCVNICGIMTTYQQILIILDNFEIILIGALFPPGTAVAGQGAGTPGPWSHSLGPAELPSLGTRELPAAYSGTAGPQRLEGPSGPPGRGRRPTLELHCLMQGPGQQEVQSPLVGGWG